MPTPTLDRPDRTGQRVPARLPRRGPTPAARRLEVLRGAAAAVVLLAVVVGVPWALVALVGNPLPSTLPARSWLDAQLSGTVVLDVLAVVLWLTWAHFTACVLAEVRAWVRGGVSARARFGSGQQVLAQRLVGAVLLLAAGAVWVPGTVPSPSTGALGAVALTGAQEVPRTPPVSGEGEAGAARAAAPAAAAAPDAAWAGRSAAAAAGPVTYVVQPPAGRHHDCLWDIAERTLGDPLRYREIFDLNVDRAQPDGSRLVDADLIRPGWVLLLPGDAAQHVPVRPVLTAPAGGPDAERPAARAEVSEVPGVFEVPGVPPAAGDDLLQRGALSAGLVAVGLLTATRRTRPVGPLAPPERGLDDPGRGAFLDRALRRLAAAAGEQGTPLPEVLAVGLGADRLVLHLADVPGGPRPPAPFTGTGTRLEVRREDLGRAATLPAPHESGRAPYPALADVARVGEEDLLVDLESAPGLVALGGDEGVARALALSMAAELVLNPWSDGVHLHLVGFASRHAGLHPGLVEDVGSLAGLLGRLEAEAAERRRAARALGVDGVLAARRSRRVGRPRPHVVVLSGPPDAGETARLERLVGSGDTELAAVVVGDVPTASWRFRCGADGSVDLGVLGVRGRAFTATVEDLERIARLSLL
ncbi:LysM peptidoglycan-binding domain-containing protein [Paenibacillus sp. TRM 82003]|uniref:LysM peptidoglycan-binding domain-containing protein n=1 Tax=Kineococcus sp. TRM81007 TaxID=2925831 RepID=UPI001F586033|nr:LysM domain-containing protein [Kineococcus sp. TRM81007]MCI2240715.1 LysM peptidoglycan-binding domain-containing protein [Kineococcus sp. TRM81007]MCI3925362.1 LysM peptidoglycan-binding domain-containing protein [Paenibacillus sp. TRM 82003]